MKARHVGFVGVALVVVAGGLGCSESAKKAPPPEVAAKKAETGIPVDNARAMEVRGEADQEEKQPEPAVERKIIYTARLKLEVEDFPKATEALEKLIEEYGGKLAEADVTGTRGSSRQGHWKVRIAPEKRAAFQQAVLKLGEPEQNNLTSQDVTAEFIDLAARIENKEKAIKRWQELFSKATTEEGMKGFGSQLEKSQEELESLKGRQKYLANLTAMTTVHVHLRERGVYVPEESPDFGTSVGRTFSGSVNALVQCGRWLALALVALVPWLPVILVVALPCYVWWRRARRKPEVIPTLAEVAESPRPADPFSPG